MCSGWVFSQPSLDGSANHRGCCSSLAQQPTTAPTLTLTPEPFQSQLSRAQGVPLPGLAAHAQPAQGSRTTHLDLHSRVLLQSAARLGAARGLRRKMRAMLGCCRQCWRCGCGFKPQGPPPVLMHWYPTCTGGPPNGSQPAAPSAAPTSGSSFSSSGPPAPGSRFCITSSPRPPGTSCGRVDGLVGG